MYQTIVDGVRASWPRACITMIDRVTIPQVRSAYEEWRKQLETLQAATNFITPVTREFTAYHGTSAEHIESICKNGFTPSKGVTMAYGFGIYFGSTFRTSWNYARKTDDAEMNYIFICKLLPGKIAPGAANQDPPPGFHSHGDFPTAPTIFAIPHAKMMIPEYLVRFSKSAEASFEAPIEINDTYLEKRLKATLKKIASAEKKQKKSKGP